MQKYTNFETYEQNEFQIFPPVQKPKQLFIPSNEEMIEFQREWTLQQNQAEPYVNTLMEIICDSDDPWETARNILSRLVTEKRMMDYQKRKEIRG